MSNESMCDDKKCCSICEEEAENNSDGLCCECGYRFPKKDPMNIGEKYMSETKAQKPSIGRVVHYQKYGTPGGEHLSEPSPAIITKVLNEDTGECQLFVMNPNGLYFNPTPYSESPKGGHWSWPVKV